ncbi:MAG: phospho-sugar mutase [Polyangiales bacterium]
MNPADTDWKALATRWIEEDPDASTRAELTAIVEANDLAALADRFGAKLEFGTAGLRGVLGAGPNRMNRAVVIRTTAGLCEYLKSQVPDAATRGVVVGYDGRRMSPEFAADAVAVIAAAGMVAHLFEDFAPTPLTAYAVEALGAAAGVMVTASHNPPEYNGYKVYWGNGAQIIPPHDVGIAAAIDAVGGAREVPRADIDGAKAKGLCKVVPAAVTARYLEGLRALSPCVEAPANLSMVYTALHGVGAKLALQVLSRWGRVSSVAEQQEPDGAFPTVAFPNPEEKGAMDLSLALARREKADVVIANDPDADRLAVAVPRGDGFVQLSGNDVGVLLGHHLLTEGAKGADRFVAMSIVSSPLLPVIARALGVRCEETLTGFKWIANRAMEVGRETGARFVFGYEEALGYSVSTLVRDKDGISAAYVVAGLAASLKAKGQTLLDRLEAIHREYGYFVSGQRSVTAKGADGMKAIATTMAAFRAKPLASFGGKAVVATRDVQTGTVTDAQGKVTALGLPPSNVIAYDLEGGGRVMLRPSGTEPKIKFYLDLCEPLAASESYESGVARARARLDEAVAEITAASQSRGGL